MREWAGELCAGAGDVGFWASSPRPADLRRYNVYPSASSAGSARRCAGPRFTLHSPTAGRACSFVDPPADSCEGSQWAHLTLREPAKNLIPSRRGQEHDVFCSRGKIRRLEKPHRLMPCILSVCSALATLLCTLLPRCCACS